MKEKRQKKIKPSRMAFPSRVREGKERGKELLLFIRLSLMYPAKLAGVPDALIFFWFFSCIKARKEEHERKELLLFSSDSLFSFLDERKEAKENQAITDGLFSPGT